jgi:hypothetical protein
MNDAQRAAFAQTGYLVIHDALSPEQLAELNAVYDANVGRLTGGPGRERGIYDTAMTTDRHGNTYEGQRMWSQAYRDLIDNPTVLPIVQEILGDPRWQHAVPSLPPHLQPRIRLDHANIHHRQPGQPKLGRLHGGPSSWHATAVYELKSVGPGDGGLGACAGSHTPAGRERLETMGIKTWRDEWTDSAWTSKHPGWPVDVPVHRLEGQAGDCIVFTEKMTHGTVPWEGADERRTLFYKQVMPRLPFSSWRC